MVLPHGSHDPHTVLPCGSWQPDHTTANVAHTADPEDPQSNEEAMACLAKQLAACKLEKQTFSDYNMVSQPKDRKVIRKGWTLHIERGPKGGTLKYKAHVVTQGFAQIEGDINESFALVTQLPPLHAAQFLAAKSNFKAHKMDAKVAYPNITNWKPYQQQPTGTPQHVERSTHRRNPRHL
jgi:hypothetical protein